MHTPEPILVPGMRVALEVTTHSWWDIRGPFEWVLAESAGRTPEEVCSVTVNGWSGDRYLAQLMMHRSLHRDHMAMADRFTERVADLFIGTLPVQDQLFR